MAYVLSSVSGNLISAASAGYAPTNSGDVSAIASAYQVVSSTATQLYAGTAYVTSINEAPISSERAGNAANASMANSAYYDGTGRLISALPDSATVSAIASSYAESGVSGKQDTLSFAYNTADQISSINGSALGGMDEAAVSGIASAYAESAVSSKADASALSGYYTTANESGFITGVDLTDYATTAYVDSALSSKADSSDLSSYVPYSSLEYNTASAISGINGSALAAGSTYSAGEGIDITDDVISVETPVDIVAGPGIVIDNPDGNTLRVSTDENYETVLWEGTAASVDTAKSGLTLTESPFNFEYVEVHWVPWAYNDAGSYKQEAVVRVHLTSSFPRIGLINEWTDESNAAMFLFSVNGYFTSTKFYTTHVKWFQIGAWTVNNTGTGQYITKIVGIHRIANN